MHVFGLWEEAEEPGEDSDRREEPSRRHTGASSLTYVNVLLFEISKYLKFV